MINPQHYLLLGIVLFALGILIVIARKHPLIILLGIELMLQAANLALCALASNFQDWGGQVGSLIMTTIVTVELVVGLSALFAYRRKHIR